MLMGSMLRYQSLYFTLPYLAMFAGYEVLFAHKDMPLLSWLKEELENTCGYVYQCFGSGKSHGKYGVLP